jgi:hypothetical protein
MEREQLEREVARRSALVYLPLSAGAALAFLLLTRLGDYPAVAQVGGAIWIALLALIVSMPIVISRTRKRLRG